MFAFDIEATGLDFWHGCRPFAWSAVYDDGRVIYDEYDVNPHTRDVVIKSVDSDKLGRVLESDEMVAHNAGFDMLGAEVILTHPEYTWEHTWDWDAIHDTMLMSHALRNLWPHNLKLLRSVFLGLGTTKVDLIQKATNHARRICRRKKFKEDHGNWRIADSFDPHWPAVKTASWWFMDMWLPATIVRLAPEWLPPTREYDALLADESYEGYQVHPWENLCKHYCIEDSMSTIVLYTVLKEALEEEGLWDQYLERKELLRVSHQVRHAGVSLLPRIHDEIKRFRNQGNKHRKAAETVMKEHGYEEPNIQSADQLRGFLYHTMHLPIIKRTEKGYASTDADTLEKLQDDIEDHHWGADFLNDVLSSRRNTKAADSLDSYLKWSVPHGKIADQHWGSTFREARSRTRDEQTVDGHQSKSLSTQDLNRLWQWKPNYLHPSIWITGTKFTRQSSSDPNIQNVGTGKEIAQDVYDFVLRESFGPRKGRVWLAYDYANIELRIWAYLCGNEEFIQAFENGKSIHLLIARELHPHLRDMSDEEASATKHYKRTKNGNFAIIYGATPRTADNTYKKRGAYNIIADRFPEVRLFTRQLHKEVKQYGYVETLTGYRLWIPPEDPHKAVSGKVQGTAGSVIGQAMTDCADYLRDEDVDGDLIIQIHDELVFDLPEDHPEYIRQGIIDRMVRIQDRIGIPLRVDGELITDNWAKGVPL